MLSKQTRNVGELQCQRDAYVQEMEALVLECELISKEDNTYRVILSDTVLFPEGGGQPCDLGTLTTNNQIIVNVLNVQRDGLHCVHTTDGPVAVNETVLVRVHWQRRFDHMQQHSGQHLISAIGDDMNLPTVSWSLGESRCAVEITVPADKITSERLQVWQRRVNEIIREHRPIRILDEHHLDDLPPLMRAKTDVHDAATGTLRWVSIEGVDVNACCGTHLKNTAELQAVIFFPTVDKLRGGSNSRVYFLAGERALMALNDALDTQKALTGLLRTTPDDHVASVVQLQAELKSSSRTCNVLWKEFAQWKGEALAKVIQECADEQVRLCWIREDANMSVLQSICSVIQDRTSAMDKPWVLITLAGLIKEGGPMLVIASDAATLSEEALKWAEKLNVKGNVNEKLRRWQGKSIESWQHVKKTAKEFGFALVTE